MQKRIGNVLLMLVFLCVSIFPISSATTYASNSGETNVEFNFQDIATVSEEEEPVKEEDDFSKPEESQEKQNLADRVLTEEEIRENPPVIDRIEYTGNLHAPDIIIEEQIKNLSVGERYNIEKAEEDIQNIYNTGYFYEVRTKLKQSNNQNIVVFDVRQNPIITEVNFEGNSILTDEEISKIMMVGRNRILNRKILREDLLNVLEEYDRMGYLGVELEDARYEENDKMSAELALRGELIITVRENTIGEININGLSDVNRPTVEQNIVFIEGKHLTEVDYKQTYHNLYETGLFEEVKIDTISSEKSKLNILVDLEEKKTGSYNIGAGYNDKKGAMFIADIKETNLFGTGREVVLDLEKNQKGYRVKGDYRNPDFLEETSFDAGFVVGQEKNDDYVTNLQKIYSRLNKNINQDTNIYGGFEVAHYDTDNPFHRDGIINTVMTGARLDTTQQIFNPQSGSLVEGRVEISHSLVGSDFDYLKLDTKAVRYFKGFSDNHAIATKAEFGFSNGEVPFYKQFVASGQNRLKSYDYGDIRGDNLLLATAEYRIPIIEKRLLGIGSISTGNAWSDNNSRELNDFVTEVSVGAEVNIGNMGNVRVDYSVNQSREDNFSISIGNTF